jgi:hypothetical protein
VIQRARPLDGALASRVLFPGSGRTRPSEREDPMRVKGLSIATAGVLLNNYAYLYGAKPDGTVVIGSMRYALAAAGVILTAAGLLLLLNWARTSREGPPRHST